METKLSKLQRMIADGDYRPAMKLAASWGRRLIGEEHADAILGAWSAMTNPDFYYSIGKDPDALIATGVEALHARYWVPLSRAAED